MSLVKLLKYILLFVLCLPALPGMAQNYHLELVPVDSGNVIKKDFPNKTEIWQYLRERQADLLGKGYLACSVDSIQEHDSVVRVRFYQGIKYKWGKIDFSGVPVGLWNQLGISESQWKNVPISPVKLANLHEKILTYCDNNGYPFATTYLDSFHRDSTGFSARFNLVKGQPQKIDSILIEGNSGISLSYLSNYLGIHQGDLYNESLLKQIHKRLQELPFLQEEKPWKIDFSINKNKLYLYLKHKPANQINGLIGLQPNTLQTGKFLLTADFLLGLQNSLGYGETIEASYKNLQPLSPQFNVHFVAPYILGTLFGLEGNFTLYKQDTTYRQVTVEGGIRYQFNAENYAKVFYQNVGNRLITPDTHAIRINQKLPDNIDFQNHGVGVTFEMNQTNYKMNPRKGAVLDTVQKSV